MNIYRQIEYNKVMETKMKDLFKQALEQAEKRVYLDAYRYYRENQSATARALGVSRGTLISRFKKWGVLK